MRYLRIEHGSTSLTARTTLLVLLLAAFAIAGRGAITGARASETCNSGTVRGTYAGFYSGFYAVTAPKKPQKVDYFMPSAVNGLVSFDGSDHWSAIGWTNAGGIYGPFSLRGKYVVNANCTGHLASAVGLSYDFFVLQHGDRLNVIEGGGGDGTVSAGQFTRTEQ